MPQLKFKFQLSRTPLPIGLQTSKKPVLTTCASLVISKEPPLTCHSDGFVLNVGKEDWQQDRVAMCFEAAASSKSAPAFSLFMSFDMRFVSLL